MRVSTNCLLCFCSLLSYFLVIQARDCPAGFERVNQKCYCVSAEKFTWFAADRKCRDLNANLLVFDSEEDALLTTKYLLRLGLTFFKDSIWTGYHAMGSRLDLKLAANVTILEHGLPLPYEVDLSHVNMDCVAFRKHKVFQYQDVPCTEEFYVVCETRVPETSF